jgi:hypothetical protein
MKNTMRRISVQLLTASASDLAGTATASCAVPHDQRR